MALTRAEVHEFRIASVAERLTRQNDLTQAVRQVVDSARRVTTPAGESLTLVPLRFGLELVLHQERYPAVGDELFMVIDEAAARRLAAGLRAEPYDIPLLEGTGAVERVTREELDGWMTAGGWTAAMVAARLGVHASLVNQWRKGSTKVSVQRSAQLRALMG